MSAHRMIPTPLDGEARGAGHLTLSHVPPSLNNAFLNAGKAGRIKSVAYRGWQTIAHIDLRKQAGWHVPGTVDISLTFARKETRADLDNLIKPVLDLLVAAGRIADDRNVRRLTAAFEGEAGVGISIAAYNFIKIPRAA